MTETTSPRRGLFSKVLIGGFGLLALIGAGLAYLHFESRSWLTARVERLRAERDAFVAAQKPERRYPFADPSEGDAAEDYQILDWLVTAPKNWRWEAINPPTEALSQGELGAERPSVVEWSGALAASLDEAKAASVKPDVLERARARYEDVGDELIAPLRRAVRRPRCTWDYEVRRGVEAPILNPTGVYSAARVMVFRASLTEPAEALELGLEVVAAGQDLCRHPSLVLHMLGLQVYELGLRSLERTLRRGSSSEAVTRVLTGLASIGAPPRFDLRGEALMFDCTIAAYGGFEVSPDGPRLEVDEEARDAFFKVPALLAQEWRTLDEMRERIAEVERLPESERAAAYDQVNEDIVGSGSALVTLGLPNIGAFRAHRRRVCALRDLALLTAAAYRHHSDKGAWPSSLQELSAVLGPAFPKEAGYEAEALEDGWRVSAPKVKAPNTMAARR